jgi:hypothetical protein
LEESNENEGVDNGKYIPIDLQENKSIAIKEDAEEMEEDESKLFKNF